MASVRSPHPAVKPYEAAPLLGQPARNTEPLYNVTQAAALLHLSEADVIAAMEAGELAITPRPEGARCTMAAIAAYLRTKQEVER